MNEYGERVEWYWQRETRENYVPMPLCPLQIPHEWPGIEIETKGYTLEPSWDLEMWIVLQTLLKTFTVCQENEFICLFCVFLGLRYFVRIFMNLGQQGICGALCSKYEIFLHVLCLIHLNHICHEGLNNRAELLY